MKSYMSIIQNKGRRLSLFSSLLVAAFIFADFEIGIAQNGKDIFKANCSACHSPASNKMTGPGLRGSTTRRSSDWLLSWVKNSGELVKSGDSAAVALVKEYNNIPMPPFALSDADITSVFTYVDELEKTEKDKLAQKAVADSLAALTANTAAPVSTKSTIPWTIIIVIVGTFALLLFLFLSYVNNIMVKAIGRGIPFIDLTEDGFFDKFYAQNRFFVNFIIVVVILAAVKGCCGLLP